MGISDTTELAILDLVFRAVTWTNYAVNATASPETTITFALHTADPGDAGTMATSESTYGSYARQTVARPAGFNAASAGAITLAANLDFPSSGGAGTTITHFSSGHSGAAASAQPILWSGDVSPTIPIGAAGVIPRLTAATQFTLT